MIQIIQHWKLTFARDEIHKFVYNLFFFFSCKEREGEKERDSNYNLYSKVYINICKINIISRTFY